MKDKMSEKTPWNDPIVAEVRAARLSLLEEVGFDLDKLGQRLRDEQTRSGHAVVTFPPRKPVGKTGEAA